MFSTDECTRRPSLGSNRGRDGFATGEHFANERTNAGRIGGSSAEGESRKLSLGESRKRSEGSHQDSVCPPPGFDRRIEKHKVAGREGSRTPPPLILRWSDHSPPRPSFPPPGVGWGGGLMGPATTPLSIGGSGTPLVSHGGAERVPTPLVFHTVRLVRCHRCAPRSGTTAPPRTTPQKVAPFPGILDLPHGHEYG